MVIINFKYLILVIFIGTIITSGCTNQIDKPTLKNSNLMIDNPKWNCEIEKDKCNENTTCLINADVTFNFNDNKIREYYSKYFLTKPSSDASCFIFVDGKEVDLAGFSFVYVDEGKNQINFRKGYNSSSPHILKICCNVYNEFNKPYDKCSNEIEIKPFCVLNEKPSKPIVNVELPQKEIINEPSISGEDNNKAVTTFARCGDGIKDENENIENCCKDFGCPKGGCDFRDNICVDGFSFSNDRIRLECSHCIYSRDVVWQQFIVQDDVYEELVEFFGEEPKIKPVFIINNNTAYGSIKMSGGITSDFKTNMVVYGTFGQNEGYVRNPENVLPERHEFTHIFQNQLQNNTQLWFEEGMAIAFDKKGNFSGLWDDLYTQFNTNGNFFGSNVQHKDAHTVGILFFKTLFEEKKCGYVCIKAMNIRISRKSKEEKIDVKDIKSIAESVVSSDLSGLFNKLSEGINYNGYVQKENSQNEIIYFG